MRENLVERPLPVAPHAPVLTEARTPLLREIDVVDETGRSRTLAIPMEQALTVYVDKRELVTLMTLGQAPELLTMGYLRNQRLAERMDQLASITVDWSVSAAAVRTRNGLPDLEARTAHRVVTTGCGQGTVFGNVLSDLGGITLPAACDARISLRALGAVLDAMRQQDNIHKRAGSVHGCALFHGEHMLVFVEDVGRHNAVDTIAGWMWLHGVGGEDKFLYTTGRLTSEMVMKAAHLGVPILISRNGVTHMGYTLASRLGMTLFGRAANQRFLCYTGMERFDATRPAGSAARTDLPTDTSTDPDTHTHSGADAEAQTDPQARP